MKKIAALIIVVLLTFCGCSSSDIDNDLLEQLGSDVSIVSVISTEEYIVTPYKAKDNYQNVSAGFSYLFQNEKHYYYCSETGFFAVDKQSKKQTLLSDDFGIVSNPYVYDNLIYFTVIHNGTIVVFDTTTHIFSTLSIYELFNEDHEKPKCRYDAQMINGGWIISATDYYSPVVYYYSDSALKQKVELPIGGCDFVLDDEIFWYDESGAILCYNLSDKKFYSVIEGFIFDKNSNYLQAHYLGKDRILFYANNCFNIFSLKTGKFLSHLYYQEEALWSVAYEEDYAYIYFEESQNNYKIEKVSFADNSFNTIYTNTIDLPYTSLSLVGVDDKYLYLEYYGYHNDDGTESSKITTINKDGSDEKLLFVHESAY